MSEVTLALSGGAARGAYHLGVLHYIEQNDIKVKAICATSIGAVIGASWLSGVVAKEQLELFKSKEFQKIFRFNFFKRAIYKVDADAAILDQLIPKKNIQDLALPLYITAVDINSGQNIYFDSGNIKRLCLAASALLPLFAPIDYYDHKLIDGGFINHMPLEPLKSMEYKIVGVNLNPIIPTEISPNIFSYTKRALGIATYRNSTQVKADCDLYITSKKLLDYSLFSFRHLDELFELGFHDAHNRFASKMI
jgi:NTE family protein